MLVGQLVSWWKQYVVTDTPPPIDGSEAWTKYLSKQFRSHVLPLKPADDLALEWFEQREHAKKVIAEAEQLKADAENHLREIIGEHEGIEGPFGKLTWKKTKDSEVTDYKKAFQLLEDGARQYICDVIDRLTNREPYPAIPEDTFCEIVAKAVAQSTTPKPGYRRFHHSQPKPTKQLAAASAGE
jgi:hypothetical protein